MVLSRRSQRIGESATLSVARKARELREEGVEIIDLSAGEPDFPSPPVAVEAARQALADGHTRYTPAAGIPALRHALAERYARDHGTSWQGRDVMVSVGGKGALFEIALALFDRDDEVVLPRPYWVSFPEHIAFCGARAVMVDADVDDGFRIHADRVIEAMSERTKAIVLNSPCNPTGGIIEAGDLRRVVATAAERGVVVVSDETYEHFVYGGGSFASIAPLADEFPETVVLVGSFSKSYSMTGWRLGFAFAPPAILDAALDIQSHATSNPTSFAMYGAVAALESGGDHVRAMVAEFARRRELVSTALEEIPGVSCPPPDGAFYAFPNVAACFGDGVDGSVALADRLLDVARVAVVPGIAFGADDHLRLSFAASRDQLREGLARIRDALTDGHR